MLEPLSLLPVNTDAPHVENIEPGEVYYLSYGSNLSHDRFFCYIQGGQPEGNSHIYKGCRNTLIPVLSFGVTFDAALYFSGDSKMWGGGGAMFADFSQPGESLGRAYRITLEQFCDVAAQESNLPIGSVDFDWDELLSNGFIEGDGQYGTLVLVGYLHGLPVLTFTNAQGVQDKPLDPPSVAYRKVIARGLEETFQMNDSEIENYFQNVLGY